MTNEPFDPANEAIDQAQRSDESYAGQHGYGVHFEDGKYHSENMQTTPTEGRSGSYETNNQGGYGNSQKDLGGHTHVAEGSTNPAGGQLAERSTTTDLGGEDAESGNSPTQRNRHLDSGQGV
ncbi:MAG: hypothetical protein H0X37_14100 [Herpetosiphonaceae bacterium]|nr:hypothetical protein [Herpetosiphonaceae bacterium]